MDDADLDRLANLLGQVSLRISTAVDEALAAESKVRPGHAAGLVALLGYADGERPEVLANALGLSQSAAVHMVDRLTHNGWVERRPDPTDGRAVRLVLTAPGRRKARRLRAARRKAIDRSIAALSETQRKGLSAPLARMAAEDLHSVAEAERVCRLCDPGACGHPETCPVTQRLDAVLERV